MTDAAKLALQLKSEIEMSGLYLVEKDGRVRRNPDAGRGKGYVPPWTWISVAVPDEKKYGPDGRLTPEYLKLVTPGSDPNSAWRDMYQEGGPFRFRSMWNDEDGTYEGKIDWLTLATTIGAGGVVGAGIAAAAGGGAGAGAGATAAPAASGGIPASSLTGAAGVTLPAGTASSGAVPAAMATGGGTASTLGTIGRYAKTASDVGEVIGSATEAAAQRQMLEEDKLNNAANTDIRGEEAFQNALIRQAQLGLDANSQNIQGEKSYQDTLYNRERLGLDTNGQNIQGEQAYQSELQAIARTEADQRGSALKDVYRASVAGNPSHSPYNPVPTPTLSEAYRQTLANLERQGAERLTNPAEYDTRTMRPPTPYTPYVAGANLPPVRPYTPYSVPILPAPRPYAPRNPDVSTSTMQQIGNWIGPTLSVLGAVGRYARR